MIFVRMIFVRMINEAATPLLEGRCT